MLKWLKEWGAYVLLVVVVMTSYAALQSYLFRDARQQGYDAGLGADESTPITITGPVNMSTADATFTCGCAVANDNVVYATLRGESNPPTGASTTVMGYMDAEKGTD